MSGCFHSNYSCPSFKCPVEIARQSSANGSGAGSRWTWATASSISRTISPRSAASAAASAHFWRSRYSSATFKQSRPTGDAFQFRINVTGVVVFAVAAKPEQCGDDQLRAAAGAGARDGVADNFQARGQIRAVHRLRLRRRNRRPCRPDRGRQTGARSAWSRRIDCWRRPERAAVFPRRPG